MTNWKLLLASLLAVMLTIGVLTPTSAYAQDGDAAVAEVEEGLEDAAEETEETAEAIAAQEEADLADAPSEEYGGQTDVAGVSIALENFILFVCAVLVIFMQAGFAMVEAGFNSQKNVINILFKNVMDLCVGVMLYAVVGFNLMYPGSWIVENWVPSPTFLLSGENDPVPAAVDDGLLYHSQTDFLFQAAFAATAATIVSGAVAGRMQFRAYLVYSALLTGIIYPFSGAWKWGGGGLDAMGFYDFAGSCVVHAVGGFAGLAGAIALGPRIGRYTTDGKSVPLPGHSISLATLGVFILLIGWFGFNPGSQLTFGGGANVAAFSKVAVNTLLAACAGGFMAMLLSWGMFGKPDISMALNGLLGGLVSITACCDGFDNHWAVVIGLIGGVLVVLGVLLLDKLKIDDPVGAFPVHGLCGIWGCMAIALLPSTYDGDTGNLVAQVAGSIAYPVWAFVTMAIVFFALKAIGWLRVSAEEEESGLDISEHGMSAYTTA